MTWESRVLSYDIELLERSLSMGQVEQMYKLAFGRSAPTRSTKSGLLERIQAYALFSKMRRENAQASDIVSALGDRFLFVIVLVGVDMFNEEQYKEALKTLYSVEVNGTRSQLFGMLQSHYSKRRLGEIRHG